MHSEWTDYTYLDRSGTTHVFDAVTATQIPVPNCIHPKLVGYSLDNSGMRLDTTTGIITFKDGSTAQGPVLFKDANGNSINAASPPSTSEIDTLGRTVQHLTGTLPDGAQYEDWIAQDSAGNPQKTRIERIGVPVCTAFGQGDTQDACGNISLTRKIDLPNGLAYLFTYDTGTTPGHYGELLRIDLPSGGYIRYEYAPISSAFPIYNTIRAVTKRAVSADGTAASEKAWTYTYQLQTPDTSHNTTLVTDPDGNQTAHVIENTLLMDGSPVPLETETRFYQGSTSLLRTVRTDYSTLTINVGDSDDPSLTPRTLGRPIRMTTILDNGLTSKVETDYDPLPDTNGVISFSRSNVTERREYDYGQGAPGPLLRRTDYTYQHNANSAYATANIVDKVLKTIVYDGAGNIVAQTLNGYDETPLANTNPSGNCQTPNGAPNHDYCAFGTGYLTRGNLTSVAHWRNTDNAWLTTTYTYDDLGNMLSSTDPGGHVTHFSFSDSWSGTSCIGSGVNTYAFVTQITNQLNQRIQASYFSCPGLVQSKRDENDIVAGRTGTTFTYDGMNRLLTENSADGGQTSFNYHGDTLPLTVTATQTATPGPSIVSSVIYDGLGRVKTTSLDSDPAGADIADTRYDDLGRKFTVSNPHRSASATTDGITTNLYDALGRVYKTTKQDGSVSSVAYNVSTTIAVNGDCTITTDEAGNQRGECSDALGRLVEMDEPNRGSPINLNYKATLLTDGNFVLENAAGTGVWSTGTYGTNAGPIYIQDDGNLVLYLFKWQAGTYAAPSPGPFPAASCSIGTYLLVNQRINANQCIVSPHGQYLLYMAPDGNFYIYDIPHNVGTWGPGTYGHPGAYAIMQGDGNLCVYDASNVYLWCSGTSGTNADRLNMEDDGRIIIYKSIWNSGTSNGQFNWTAIAHPGCDVGNSGLGSTGVLWTGSCIVSPNGHFELLMQTDGNLVIYDLGVSPAHALWSTNTAVLPTDPAVAMRTLYSYDALGNLLRVDQKGTAPNDSTQWRTRTFTYDSLSRLLSATNPESGAITYAYDADGNLLQKTSPAPNQTGTATQTISYCYDALHRVTGKGYGAQSCPLTTPVVSYAYDSGTNAIGHLTSLTDQAGIATYTYDIMGRLASEARPIAGVSKTTSYTYYLDGSVKTLTYPSGRVLTYTPDSAGRPASVVDGNGTQYVSSTTYYPNSAEYQRFMPNIYFRTDLNPRLQVSGFYSDNGQTSSFFINKTYSYGALHQNNGDVMSITNNKDSNRTQTFTYDQLNRITAGWSSANTGNYSWGENYAVDAWGNLQITPMSGKAHGGNFAHSGTVQNQAAGLGYDAAGNLTNYTYPSQYVYDQENRLLSTAGITYTYDGNGERVLKSQLVNNVLVPVKRYWSMGGNTFAESDGSGNLTAEYIYFGGKRVARIDLLANTVHYYLSDHLGSTSIVVSSAGTVEEESDYYPFGTEVVVTGPGVNRLKFTGKERDSESGLDSMGARYYSNGLGRFAIPDYSELDPFPVPSADFENPQSLNLYAYVHNSPLVNIDPDGHDCVIQTRTGDKTESVSVSSGTCKGVKVGDGQSKTYVPGTTDVSRIHAGTDGNSIDIGYTPYEGGGTGVSTAAAAPYPDNPNLAYGFNQEAYRTLTQASMTVDRIAIATGVVAGTGVAAIAGSELLASTTAARSGIVFRLAHGLRLELGHRVVLSSANLVKNAIAAAVASGAFQQLANGVINGQTMVNGQIVGFTGFINQAGQVIISNVFGGFPK
jgi:RHS repeat-associated protein